MTEHQEWQKKVALSKFQNSPDTMPRQERIARAAAYTGASISEVEAWARGAGL